ncbi:hypothetical protein CYMTET_49168 [Cymbomonas tetramitiformis]|uniref:Uncharacterized protein n=1 Tax=Cymbomonas tetramitiformis TaxID=36881 RepID=A0AAE0BQR6_9CHLO|nr:hypothetical protein CYMTET_49168 [Cymbomonas tetramitiformis]
MNSMMLKSVRTTVSSTQAMTSVSANRGRIVHSARTPCKVQARRRVTTTAALSKEIISTDAAPAALGPYSQAVKVGSTLYCSGCLGLIPETMAFVDDTVEGQTEQAMKNMGEILAAAGGSHASIVKTTILLDEIADFKAVNEIYGKYFPEAPPARSTFAVKQLPLSAKIEIECIAHIE